MMPSRHALGRMSALLMAVSLALSVPRPVAASVQVSDEFRRVAKIVVKRYAASALAGLCDEAAAKERVYCRLVVGAVTDLFVRLVDGDATAEAVSGRIVTLVGELARAGLLERGSAQVGRLLELLLPTIEPVDSGLASQVSVCFATRVFGDAEGELAECTKALERLLALSGAAPEGAALRGCVTAAPKSAAGVLGALRCAAQGPDTSETYLTLVVLQQVQGVVERGVSGSAYEVVSAAADQLDEALYRQIDSAEREVVLDHDAIREAIAASSTRCPGHVVALQKWLDECDGVVVAVSRALSRGEEITPILASLPPDPWVDGCEPLGERDEDPIATLRMSAIAYRVDLELASSTDRVAYLSLAAALLVDYIATRDRAQLERNLGDLTLRLVARAIAAVDGPPVRCVQSGGSPHWDCARLDGTGPSTRVVVTAADPDSFVNRRIEARSSPLAARATCLYQAMAWVLRGSVPLDAQDATMCRLLDDDPTAALLGTPDVLAPAYGSALARWQPAYLVKVTRGVYRLQGLLADEKGARAAWVSSTLDVLGRLVGGGVGPRWLSTLLADLAADGVRPEDMPRQVLAAAARELRPLVSDLLDANITPLATCTGEAASTSVACAVRLLAAAAYAPAIDLVVRWDADGAVRQVLVSDVMTELVKLDPLGRSLLLFDVGLGVTGVLANGNTAHFTVLDKIGVAGRFGDDNRLQVGAFVGGFLDALVRELADDSVRRYWMVGAVIGWRELSSSFPLGLEAHVGAALPYELTRQAYEDGAALAVGLTLTVPIDLLFVEE